MSKIQYIFCCLSLIVFCFTGSFTHSSLKAQENDKKEKAETKVEPKEEAKKEETSKEGAPKEEESKEGEENKEEEKKDESLPEGHSFHGEAFNEGPRQKAYLMGTTGNVHFEITTKNKECQAFFNQGIGQLHGFWYFEAERSFRHAATLDPDCAMVYWGMAMSNFQNEKRARGFMEKAMERLEGVTEREKLYLEGFNNYLNGMKESKKRKDARKKYVKNLEKIIIEFPDDIEAKAFLAVRLWNFNRDLPIHSHVAVSALIQQVLDKNPMHPIHHYRIHLWDYERPDVALKSAALCGQSAPGIAHMWHMSGHIFSRLKRYQDAAWQQEASARVDHAHMMRDLVLPDQIHNYAHNNEWLIRNLIKVGRVQDAIDLAKNMIELPRHPKYNTLRRRGRSASYGRSRLFDVLQSFELWEELIDYCNTVYLEPTDIPREQIKRIQALARAYYSLGDYSGLKEQVAILEGRINSLEKSRQELTSVPEAEEGQAEEKVAEKQTSESESASSGSNEAQKDSEKSEAEKKNSEEKKKELTEEEKKAEEEAKKAKEAKEKEKKERERKEREIKDKKRSVERALEQVKFLLQLAEKQEIEEKEFLKKVGRLSKGFEIRELIKHMHHEKAVEKAQKWVEGNKGEVLPLAHHIEALEAAGKPEEADKVFKDLQEISSFSKLDIRAYDRIRGIIERNSDQKDWRPKPVLKDDIGKRPPLDDLGPFRWQAPKASEWSLPVGGSDKKISLSDYRGKPVIVIFYLGYGCLHCVEQLHAFSPKTEVFEKMGISLVAISTEKISDVTDSLKKFDDKADFPFPLLADPELKIFKQYRAFDDFENFALHGTFLIDPEGKVQWQDISYEPFMEVDFLIGEAGRLLGQSETLKKAKKQARF